jgi:hypothetical protein
MNKKIRVIPAILTDQPAELERMLRLCQTFTDFAQIDIMDGRLRINSLTIERQELAAPFFTAKPRLSLRELSKAPAAWGCKWEWRLIPRPRSGKFCP